MVCFVVLPSEYGEIHVYVWFPCELLCDVVWFGYLCGVVCLFARLRLIVFCVKYSV